MVAWLHNARGASVWPWCAKAGLTQPGNTWTTNLQYKPVPHAPRSRRSTTQALHTNHAATPDTPTRSVRGHEMVALGVSNATVLDTTCKGRDVGLNVGRVVDGEPVLACLGAFGGLGALGGSCRAGWW